MFWDYKIFVNSSNSRLFDRAKTECETALENCKYSAGQDFVENNISSRSQRRRNIIWFNSPFIKAAKAKVGKVSLNLLNKRFFQNKPLKYLIEAM